MENDKGGSWAPRPRAPLLWDRAREAGNGSFVLSDRRAVRDYVDVCALVETVGMADAVQAMQPFARLYQGY